MTDWTRNDLERIGAADELQLASIKQDGTLRKPVTMWVVRVGDDLYVRAYKGREGAWFRHTQQQHEGQIEAGGVKKHVTFVDTSSDETLNDAIDAAYQSKYRGYGAAYVDPMITSQARTTTLKLQPLPAARTSMERHQA
ncbi:hypothetical protein KSF_094490 [Reticulibacter mediterranei]|uniref:DUF2255 domain-containing protein n=1 Tax=Reticulibacter mediterranei TaxID=2778369 RepID=A0A8J3IRG0_9CHLR|nr:DUF2255 family protein [Reticulibacter mediterranei]GHO99401.1 hypothetical protein KSF_094490 [Reticulibacter mediterranei]